MLDLFKMFYADLLEMYVRFIFGKALGDPNVETRIRSESVQKLPDTQWWLNILQQANVLNGILGREAEVVLKWATPVSHTNSKLPDRISEAYPRMLHPLLYSLSKLAGSNLFYGFDQAILIAPPDTGYAIVRRDFDWQSRYCLEPISALQVAYVLLAEWSFCRGKANQARTFLCGLVDNVITPLREEAEEAFKKAVAVSQDGTVLLCVDQVFVVTEKNCLMVPKPELHEQKILLAPGLEVLPTYTARNRNSALREFRASGDAQAIFSIPVVPGKADGEFEKVLCTRQQFSPFQVIHSKWPFR